ncbi:MAG: Mini-ribonuclease 3 [Streptococcaceae bacterium]|jgi:ribonuclease-3 family protein|nr:Mini-ribonuclease 3 [Streptococcaceae bacterium]
MNPNLINGIALAYLGDAIYEFHIREHLILKGLTKPNLLHKTATHFVSAKAQAYLFEQMSKENILTDVELATFKRGRNAKSHTTAKNTDPAIYKVSTGFEAVIGYLHLSGQKERIEALIDFCIQTIESKGE